jgi:hypothetical protein
VFSTRATSELDRFIEGAFNCLVHVPGFNANKNWDKLPKKDELAMFLLSEIIRLTPKGFDWMINNENQDPFCLFYYKIITSEVVKYAVTSIEWLPEIYKVDPLLYELVCATISKISTRYNIDLLTDDLMDFHIYDSGMWDSEEIEEDERARVFQHVNEYKTENGKAIKLLRYIQRQGENYSDKVLIDSILNLKKSKAKLKGEVIEWLILAIPCLKKWVDINRFHLPLDGYEDGALTIRSNYGFYYSFLDEVAKRAEEWRNETYSNIGEMDAAQYFLYSEDGASDIASYEPLKYLNQFMFKGRHIYIKFFEQKYQKQYEVNE